MASFFWPRTITRFSSFCSLAGAEKLWLPVTTTGASDSGSITSTLECTMACPICDRKSFRVTSPIYGPRATSTPCGCTTVYRSGLNFLSLLTRRTSSTFLSLSPVSVPRVHAPDVHALLVGPLAGERMQSLLPGREHEEQDGLLGRGDDVAQGGHVSAVGGAGEPDRELRSAHREGVRLVVRVDE